MTVSGSSGRSNGSKRKSSPRPRGRPPLGKQPLSRALVLKQALALLDAGGLVNLSMRVLAQRLGVGLGRELPVPSEYTAAGIRPLATSA